MISVKNLKKEDKIVKKSKRIVAACMSVLIALPGFAGLTGAAAAEEEPILPEAKESYYLVGRLQQEGSMASASQPLDGQVTVNI